MSKDEPISKEAQEFADKIFPCQQPCDSYGICTECAERTCFLAGYNFGYRAGKKSNE